VFPSGSSVTRRPPWLLTGFRGSVSLLSGATMETLRLPLSVSKASLRSALDTSSCLACLLTPAAKVISGVPGCCLCQCPPLFWPFRKGDRRLSQVSREPFRTSALLSDPGRTIAVGFWRSGAAPADIKTKAPAITIFRGSITRLLYSLHTLDAAISDDSPMLASGRLPPFPGGLFGPTGFLQRISTSGYPIVSFLSGLILTLYVGLRP
jgi:hypothetical protein